MGSMTSPLHHPIDWNSNYLCTSGGISSRLTYTHVWTYLSTCTCAYVVIYDIITYYDSYLLILISDSHSVPLTHMMSSMTS
jgi:hypothetical protein